MADAAAAESGQNLLRSEQRCSCSEIRWGSRTAWAMLSLACCPLLSQASWGSCVCRQLCVSERRRPPLAMRAHLLALVVGQLQTGLFVAGEGGKKEVFKKADGTALDPKVAAISSLGRGATADVQGIVRETRDRGAKVESAEFRMDQVRVTQEDQYSCHQHRAPQGIAGSRDASFGIAFEAVKEAFGGRVHHMLVFGCDGEPNFGGNFACGMSNAPCRGLPRQTFLFGWAKDADGIALPEHAGFAIGPNSQIKTIVIQVHYAKPLPDPDSSGVRMYYTTTPQEAGITHFSGVVSGVAASKLVIPAGQAKTDIPITCKWQGPEPLTVFAYRVHAHDLAKVCAHAPKQRSNSV
jgi:hypothetical protein